MKLYLQILQVLTQFIYECSIESTEASSATNNLINKAGKCFTFRQEYSTHCHPKDGEGNSFSLFVSSHPGGGGGGGVTPVRSRWDTSMYSVGRSGWGVPEMGYPQARNGVSPCQGWGTPQAREGVPPGIGQHMEYLIRSERYASCVHAGGLSCPCLHVFSLEKKKQYRTLT